MAQKDYTEFETHIFENEKGKLPYRLLKPAQPRKGEKYPLVIFFHGAGERGADNIVPLTHIAPLFVDSVNRVKFPCYVLVPQCPKDMLWVDTDWRLDKHTQPKNPSFPLQMVLELIDKIQEENSIDEQKMYVTGLSMGGFATWDIITRFPEKFACAVPICGGGDEKTAEKITNLPIWAFHGLLDKVVKVSRTQNMIKAIEAKGGNPKYTEYATVQHDSWKNAYKEPQLLKWMFKQKK